MEVIALAALLGVGYMLTPKKEKEKEKEQFMSPIQIPAQYQIQNHDQTQNLNQGQDQNQIQKLLFGTPEKEQETETQVETNPAGQGQFISQLSGLVMDNSEFTHGNMVPFFRGSVKQNTSDNANRSLLDNMIGTGFNQIEKREQPPMFKPTQMGNVTGFESTTDYMHDRVVPSTNRAFEKPIESTRVGPGINQGFSSLPIGGFQQTDVLEIGRDRLTVDALRVESNPKLSYEGMLNPGMAIGSRGEIGEVRKYNPDRFYLNEDGERNFVNSTSDNIRPMVQSSQIMKFQARQETSAQNFSGPAVSSDFSATYATQAFRAPHTNQHDNYGWRNADGSAYGLNPDAPNNDFGASAMELPVNQRNVTSERGQGLNLTGMAAAPQALTVHDPNDVWRTTVRETTGANDWVGIATGAKKLTVYDPTDIPRITTRNTMAAVDTAMNVTRAGVPGQRTLQIPDGWKTTLKETITSQSAYTGAAGNGKGDKIYDTAYAMNQNGVKELTAMGRKPLKGNGVKPLFKGVGDDTANMTQRKIMSDVFNDRDNTANRVIGPTTGTESIGLQRPKQVLHMDVAVDRNNGREVLGMLDSNPYVQSIHRIANQ